MTDQEQEALLDGMTDVLMSEVFFDHGPSRQLAVKMLRRGLTRLRHTDRRNQ